MEKDERFEEVVDDGCQAFNDEVLAEDPQTLDGVVVEDGMAEEEAQMLVVEVLEAEALVQSIPALLDV